MATTNQSSIKISVLAKELKMKSGKELIEKLSLEQKDFKPKVFRAIQRFPMPGWEVVK